MINVSVIIPVFNRPEQVLQAISSVLSQTYSSFELIVVDDDSTTDLSSAEKLVKDSGHKFLRVPRGGVSRSRNVGVQHARGEWLSFLDSDDRWLTKKLEKQVQFHTQSPQYVISQCEEIWFRNGVRVNPRERHKLASEEAFSDSLKLCCISPSSVMIRRDVFLVAGGFDEQMVVCEDYDLWLRVTAKHRVGVVSEALVEKFGGHSDQLSRSQPAMDRFRVYSMVKLLLEGGLHEQQIFQVLTTLQNKADVLALGAKKRGNQRFETLYQEVSLIALEGIDRGIGSVLDPLRQLFSALFLAIRPLQGEEETLRGQRGFKKGSFEHRDPQSFTE